MPHSQSDAQKEWPFIPLLGLLAFAALFRFYRLGHESLWFDEAISFSRSGHPLGELVRESVRAYHNPTYFVLLRGFRVFGDSEFALRLPSALFGVAKVGLTYALGRLTLGHRGGLVAAWFILLSPAQIHYDQEARMYAPLLFAIALALCGVFWLVTRWEALEAVGRHEHRRAAAFAWACYVFGTSFALYLHNIGSLFVVTCWLVVGSGFLLRRKLSRPVLWGWLSANAVVMVALLPWLGTLFVQVDAMQDHGYGRDFPSLREAVGGLRDVYLMGRESAPLQFLVASCAIFGLWFLRGSRLLVTAIALAALVPAFLVLLISLREPMFLPRLFLWAAIPFSLLVAAGIVHLSSTKVRALVVFALLGLGMHTLWQDYYGRLQKPDWRGAIQQLAREADAETVVLSIGNREWRLFHYYFERMDDPIPRFPVEFDVRKMRSELPTMLRGKKRAVTIRARDSVDVRAIRDELAARGTLEAKLKFGTRLWIERYRLRPELEP
jgi:uncharacterized membrane protein